MKVINFFGAPGAGKTTISMKVCAELKTEQIDAELSLEIVKQHIFAGNENMLSYQNYIFAEQERQLRILDNSQEVEFAITDAPLLNSAFYEPEKYPVFFKELVFEMFRSYDNINFLIKRTHPFSNQGRVHNEIQSNLIEAKLPVFLMNHNIPFIEINSTDDIKENILDYIIKNHRVDGYIRKKR